MIASCGCEKGPILGRLLNLCMKFKLRRLFDLLHGPIVLPPSVKVAAR